MAAKKPSKAPEQPQIEEPKYPHIEAFAEQAGTEDVAAVFAPLKESLGHVKGPRADAAKKAVKSVERTEELLNHLLEVREKLRAERKGAR
jgi:hypothetical protein